MVETCRGCRTGCKYHLQTSLLLEQASLSLAFWHLELGMFLNLSAIAFLFIVMLMFEEYHEFSLHALDCDNAVICMECSLSYIGSNSFPERLCMNAYDARKWGIFCTRVAQVQSSWLWCLDCLLSWSKPWYVPQMFIFVSVSFFFCWYHF